MAPKNGNTLKKHANKTEEERKLLTWPATRTNLAKIFIEKNGPGAILPSHLQPGAPMPDGWKSKRELRDEERERRIREQQNQTPDMTSNNPAPAPKKQSSSNARRRRARANNLASPKPEGSPTPSAAADPTSRKPNRREDAETRRWRLKVLNDKRRLERLGKPIPAGLQAQFDSIENPDEEMGEVEEPEEEQPKRQPEEQVNKRFGTALLGQWPEPTPEQLANRMVEDPEDPEDFDYEIHSNQARGLPPPWNEYGLTAAGYGPNYNEYGIDTDAILEECRRARAEARRQAEATASPASRPFKDPDDEWDIYGASPPRMQGQPAQQGGPSSTNEDVGQQNLADLTINDK